MNDFTRISENVDQMISQNAAPQKIRDYLHQEGMTSDQFRARLEGMKDSGLGDTAVKYSAGSGVANLADLPARTGVNVGNLAKAYVGTLGKVYGLLRPDQMPTPDNPTKYDVANPLFRKAGLINDAYAPTTTAGHAVDFATQALTGGGVNPAQLARNAAKYEVGKIARDVVVAGGTGAGAGLGSALTENVDTGNESLNNALKIAASLGGGAVGGVPFAMRGNAGDRARAMLKNTTPEELKLADARQRLSYSPQVNSPLIGMEAIQAETGLNPKMQTIQRLIEQSDHGTTTTMPIIQKRPEKNAALLDRAVTPIAPKNDRPDTLAGTLRTAAEDAINSARNKGNLEAGPAYANSANNPSVKIPSAEWNAAVSDPAIAAALQTVKKNPFGGLQNATEGSVQWLDAAKKWLDSQSQVVGANRYEAGNQAAAARRIVDAVDPSVPDYAKARAIIAKNMQENVVPMQEGQVGKLAQSNDFTQQWNTLLPPKARDVTPTVINNTAEAINAENPDILRQFLGHGLRHDFNEVAGGGIKTNPMGGYQFAVNVADNPMQKQNLIAAINAAGADAQPFQTALDMFRAQGFKPHANSATVANASEIAAMTPSTNPVANPGKAMLQVIPSAIDKWRNGGALEEIAKASVGPDAVLNLEQMARMNGVHDPMKQQMLINLLLANPQ